MLLCLAVKRIEDATRGNGNYRWTFFCKTGFINLPGSHWSWMLHTECLWNLHVSRSTMVHIRRGTAAQQSTSTSAQLMFTPMQTTPYTSLIQRSILHSPSGLHKQLTPPLLSRSISVCDTQNPTLVPLSHTKPTTALATLHLCVFDHFRT